MNMDMVEDGLDNIDGAMKKLSVIVDAIKKRPGLFTIVGLLVVVAGGVMTVTAYRQYTSSTVKGKAIVKEVTSKLSKQKEDGTKDSEDGTKAAKDSGEDAAKDSE